MRGTVKMFDEKRGYAQGDSSLGKGHSFTRDWALLWASLAYDAGYGERVNYRVFVAKKGKKVGGART